MSHLELVMNFLYFMPNLIINPRSYYALYDPPRHDQKLQWCLQKGSKCFWFMWCTLDINLAGKNVVSQTGIIAAAQIEMIRTIEERKEGMVKSRTDVLKGVRLQVELYPYSLIPCGF